ncbi:MAG: aminodeoxychorismate/anthranilate synthase component II [Lachnospiraceae bacterium]|nr:aminodeoxychorismate/anthranilate synthase component II [Lachnospiraceae bacterium]
MILLIDNYDSFSYNLYQMIGAIAQTQQVTDTLQVIRNDAWTIEEIRQRSPAGIILSPGPGRPEDAGICMEVVEKLGGEFPILGVCLGHQAICAAYGATVSYAKKLMHGKQSTARIDRSAVIFAGCKDSTTLVGRYHSLAAIEETMPPSLRITARADDGEIMAVEHREYAITGVQFHPESILTPEGEEMLRSWYLACEQRTHAGASG